MSDGHALTRNQEAQWFLHQLAPEATAYHTGVAVRIRSAVDVAALGAAVRALGSRHEMLRSVFIERDGRPVRLVRPDSLVELAHYQVTEALAVSVRRSLHRPFDLGRTGAFRIALHSRTPEDAVLLIAGHHIATDAASDAVLLADLLALYGHEETDAHEATDSHEEYVLRERKLLSSPLGATLETYWADLCRSSGAVTLPSDRPRPARQSFTGGTCRTVVPAEDSQWLRQTALDLGVSLFALLLAVFQGVLYRYTRQDDFLVGCPVSTRLSSRSRRTVGNYVNTLVFRARFTAATTFREAAEEAHRQLRQGMAGLRYPFAHLARVLADSREAGQSAVYQVTFNLLSTAHAPAELRTILDTTRPDRVTSCSGLSLSAFPLPQQEGQVDLGVDVLETEDALAVDIRYDSSLFDQETVEQFAAHFTRAVALAAERPDGSVARARIWGQDRRFRPVTNAERRTPPCPKP
ncbi:condensation domain-containing protein [Streptomyces sp. NBC_00988]|uniref:condensation domain-containing protein n=1 Tax=Streptomyces sp. NBC_00988 TaxID=2903704 RepID=UPI00386E4716|nr:condensation domain-containing protein [Streptomyces sp. NBC_00988]